MVNKYIVFRVNVHGAISEHIYEGYSKAEAEFKFEHVKKHGNLIYPEHVMMKRNGKGYKGYQPDKILA